MKPIFLVLLILSLFGCYSLKKASEDQTQTKQKVESHHDINQVVDTTKTGFSKVTITEVDYITVPDADSGKLDTVRVPVLINSITSTPIRFKQITYQNETKQNGMANKQELIDTKEKTKADEQKSNQLDTSFSLVELLLAGGIIVGIMAVLFFYIKTKFPV